MRILLLLLAAAFVLPAAYAQDGVTVLFTFEGEDNMGTDADWEPSTSPDPALGPNAQSKVQVLTDKAVAFENGQPIKIEAFEGTWLLEGVANRPIPANEYRGMKYTWGTAQNWTATPVLTFAASMQSRGTVKVDNVDKVSEKHEYRVTVTAADGSSTERVYVGLASLGFRKENDRSVNNGLGETVGDTFVNEWQVLTFDLSGFAGIGSIKSIQVEGRHADDGSNNTPDAAVGSWGGTIHIDQVTVQARSTSVEGTVGLAALGDVYPNPAASRARLAIEVETAQRVTATVHDVLGRTVATAFDGPLAPGATALLGFETAQLAPGTYVVRVRGETFAASRRMTIAR